MATYATDIVKYHANTSYCGIVKAVERVGGFLDVTIYDETYRFFRGKDTNKVRMPDNEMVRAVLVYGYFVILELDDLINVIRSWQNENLSFREYLKDMIEG